MAQSNWSALGEWTKTTWGILTRFSIVLFALFTAGVVIREVVRECRYDGISLETVIVKGPAGEGAPTVEMATQQMATYIDRIQKTGAREWRQHDLAEGEQPDFTIQVPGSPLNVDSIVRELAGLFPHRRRVLRISITPNPSSNGHYIGAIAVSDGSSITHATCQTDDSQDLGKMFECLAVNTMTIIDPLFAASYVLSVEEEKCAEFRPEVIQMLDPVVSERELIEIFAKEQQILALRNSCGFDHTRALVSTIIKRGRPDDQPWVSYLYGRLHLARAEAVAQLDREAEWYEFDRATDRFENFRQLPGSELAIQTETYIRNSISNQESVFGALAAHGKQSAIVDYRLNIARQALVDAGNRLKEIADDRQKTLHPPTKEAADYRQDFLQQRTYKPTDDERRFDAIIAQERGLILYRRWMIKTDFKHPHGEFGVADDEEKKQLNEAVASFETAQELGGPTYALSMVWGNALLAMGDFDAAVKQYRRANDINSKKSDPLLNVAIALLKKSKFSSKDRDKNCYDALRQTSSYLTWLSEGGPFDILVDRVSDALDGIGENKIKSDFHTCQERYKPFEALANRTDLSHTAALDLCVDEARDSLSDLVAQEAIGPSKERSGKSYADPSAH